MGGRGGGGHNGPAHQFNFHIHYNPNSKTPTNIQHSSQG